MKSPSTKHDSLSESQCRVQELLIFSKLIERFMQIKRATFRSGRQETDGEHTLHLLFLGVAYTSKYHPEFDPAEVAVLLLLHDLEEIYCGDTNSLILDTDESTQKAKREALGQRRLRRDLQEWPYLLEMAERYWKQEEAITTYCRSLDKVDASFSHAQDDGQAIRAMSINDVNQFYLFEERVIEQMASYAPDDVLAVRRALGPYVARAAFDI